MINNIRDNYRHLTQVLIDKCMTITTMESCTSGQIASLITDTEGSSSVMKGAFVTYSNEAKIMCGVPAKIIDKYTVYSKETAEAMARACAKAYDADIGIGVTGTIGNVDHNNPEASIPGRVYFAFDINGETTSYCVEIDIYKTRFEYKLAVAKEIYDALIRELEDIFDERKSYKTICNDCKHLSITETEQRQYSQRCNVMLDHICYRYHQRVYHISNSKHAVAIFPCHQCIKNGGYER